MAVLGEDRGVFAYTIYNFIALRLSQNGAWPCAKDHSAERVQNHVSIERCRKSFTTIVLGDLDFPLTASNFGNLTAFTAIFSHIFTAHAQKRLCMNFRLKF